MDLFFYYFVCLIFSCSRLTVYCANCALVIMLVSILSIKYSGGVDAIDDLQADMQENMDMVNEISEVMGQSMGEEFDDDDIAAELEELEADLMEEDMMKDDPTPSTASNVHLPDVPSDRLPDPMVQDDPMADEDADALAQLEMEMA